MTTPPAQPPAGDPWAAPFDLTRAQAPQQPAPQTPPAGQAAAPMDPYAPPAGSTPYGQPGPQGQLDQSPWDAYNQAVQRNAKGGGMILPNAIIGVGIFFLILAIVATVALVTGLSRGVIDDVARAAGNVTFRWVITLIFLISGLMMRRQRRGGHSQP